MVYFFQSAKVGLSANLAKREILPMPKIVMNAQEKRAYNELEDYCHELSVQISAHSDDSGWRSSLGFFLNFLRLRFASSLYAIRETVRRRREKVISALSQIGETPEADIDILAIAVEEDDEVDEEAILAFLKNRTPADLAWERDRLADMLLTLEDLSDIPSKMSKLLSALEERRIHGGRVQQTVIFTRFYDTLQDIVQRLRQIDQSMLIGTYSGKGGQFVDPQHKKFVGIEREEIKHRFLRGEIDVLVCTDAAAEGLNLQTADLLINYDLPWNPMKVEQRIGRIDRIGQNHSRIFVLNLCYADSAEQIVYGRLLQRLMQAGHVVGLQQFSLLPISPEEFGELAAGKLSPEKLEAIAKERIALQRQRTESMEIPARDLYEIYSRLSDGQHKRAAPVTLDSIWKTLSDSKYLRDKGCAVLAGASDKLMILRGLETIPDNTVLTTDRQLYEQGLSEMEGRLHFASYGDPIFDAVLEEFENFELPDCIARITEKVRDTQAEVIAYGVACINDEGVPNVRLVKSWRDLQGIQLDETARLQNEDLSIIKNRLHDIVRDEFDPTRAVQRLEKDNRKAGKAQLLFDLLVMQSLLKPVDLPDDDNFWSFVNDHLDILINERQRLLIPDLPVKSLKKIKNELLFSLQLPQVEQTVMITLPITYVKAAVDAGCRVAERKRVKRSDQSIGMVRSSIKSELNF